MTAPADRPARRPPGWSPGGPRPLGAQGRADLIPGSDETLSFLTGDFRVFQRARGHRWSLDHLVTAWFATTTPDPPPRRTLDLGCGIGSVLMMTAWRFPEADCTGIEAQSVSVGLARRSIAYNGIADRCRVIEGDFRSVTLEGRFDRVTGTPPYFPPGTGIESTTTQCAPCRFEHRGGVEAYVDAAARWVDVGSSVTLCAAAGSWRRVERATQGGPLSFEAMIEVVPRDGKAPLIELYRLRCAPLTMPRAHAVLTVRDREGQWTEPFRAIRATMGLPPSC